MNAVDAISKEQVQLVHSVLLQSRPTLYADVWKVGVNVGLRISDLLKLKFKDINIQNREITITEQKTGKRKTVRLNAQAITTIEQRRETYPDDRYLFQCHTNRSSGAPIGRVSVGRVFKEVGDSLGLRISTHSMRKSRGMAMYDAGIPVEKIALVLNHSSPATTLVYLGITKRQILDTYDEFEL